MRNCKVVYSKLYCIKAPPEPSCADTYLPSALAGISSINSGTPLGSLGLGKANWTVPPSPI